MSRIRYALDIEHRAMAEVYVKSWRAAYRGLIPNSFLDCLNAERFMHIFMNGVHPHAVLETQSRLGGVTSFGPARDCDLTCECGEIVSLYLLPEYIGMGHGRALLCYGLAELRGMGYKRCVIWTLEQNRRARKVYEAAGFTWDGGEKLLNFDGTGVMEVRYGIDLV